MFEEGYATFQWKKYKIIWTKHSLERMEQRWINVDLVISCIENYDRFYESYDKKVVEKEYETNILRTIFDIQTNNIILITTMFLWK